MKRIFLLSLLAFGLQTMKAANGDSIFNMVYIHSLYITFPYPNFYDSLINTNNTDLYLPVSIQFNNKTMSDVGIKVKGNSSFNNPSQKKSFKLDFNAFVQGGDLHGLKKLHFNNSFKDPSFMREKLANDFLREHGVPAPRTTYCNVYFNNQLWGLYTIVEAIDDEFCDRWFNSNDGNLFNGDPRGDLRWKGSATQSLYEPDYELENNSTANDWSDLIGLINVVNNTPQATLVAALDTKLNTAAFMKQWAGLNLFSSLDSYIGSGHNYYIYHDTVTDKFQWIAWDNNEAFGGFKFNMSSTQLKQLDIYYVSNPATSRPLVNAMLANPTYKAMYNSAYCELKNDFNIGYLGPRIDSMRNVITQSVYNDPKKFYSNTKFDSSFNYDVNLPGPMGMTVFGIKSFITERGNALTANFATNGVACWPTGVSNYPEKQMILYPNPSTGQWQVHGATLQSVRVTDLMGRSVHCTWDASGTIALDPIAPRGLYLVWVNHAAPQKMLLER